MVDKCALYSLKGCSNCEHAARLNKQETILGPRKFVCLRKDCDHYLKEYGEDIVCSKWFPSIDFQSAFTTCS